MTEQHSGKMASAPKAASLDAAVRGLEPTIIVIFGITGDLAQRKLLPALYHLVKDGLLHEKTILVGSKTKGLENAKEGSKVTIKYTEKDGQMRASEINPR